MKEYHVRIWTLSASYVQHIRAQNKEAAIKHARLFAMEDMKNWNYSAQEADEDCENGDCT